MSRNKTAILVGGPADGRRVVLREHQNHLNVAQQTHTIPYSRHPDVSETVAVACHTVQYEVFFGEGDILVMCPLHMCRREAMGRLLQGYTQEVWS